MTALLLKELQSDFVDFSESISKTISESIAESAKNLEEARKKRKAFVVSWTKIAKQRRKGGLTTRLLRAQIMKQRRRYRGRTGRRGFFLRMRPKLIRNLRKAMRASARIKAVRHRRWTMRRAGSIIKRFQKMGGIEKFTGRARIRRKKVVAATPKTPKTPTAPIRKISIASYRPKKKKKRLAASHFYGISPIVSEAFISDSSRGDVSKEDMLTFVTIESETVENPLFPIAFTVASMIEESDCQDKFFDADIIDDSIYLYFDEMSESELETTEEVLKNIGDYDLLVKHGDKMDDVTVSDFNVFSIVPSEDVTGSVIEDIVGSEEEYVEEAERDANTDDYSMLLVLEKALDECLYDEDIDDKIEQNGLKTIEESVPDDFVDEGILDLDVSEVTGLEDVELVVDEKYWSAAVTDKAKWHPPAGLFAKGSSDKIASVLKKASKNLKQAMSRLNFMVNRADPKESRDSVWNDAKSKLRKLFKKD